ncbi:ATP-binding cassette domain-containing protein [Streptomyces sp. NPDC088785]|uniref:ATP-binding cassette domain-containing protein n=1 Tax=Streptomyces sp. NPDC088785 TaxID=3365897 RepID=UPI00380F2509
MTSIDVQNLTKEYGAKRAVDRLSFRVEPGRVTGFLGPNGAGKSTTMRLALGLARPTAGTVLVGGRPYAAHAAPLRRVGALLDPQAAHGARTARDHLLALAVGNGLPARRVDDVLEQAGIAAVARRRVKTFSLGMRQRLGIAAALLGDPDVVLLDEPANGLDPEGIVWIRELLRDLAREGRTVLVSSHLMNETATFADHLVVLGRGRLLADLPMPDFIAAHSTRRAHVRTTDPERLRALLTRAGHTVTLAADGRCTVDGARAAEIGARAAADGLPVLELVDEQVSLEQAYLTLTARDTEFAATSLQEA